MAYLPAIAERLTSEWPEYTTLSTSINVISLELNVPPSAEIRLDCRRAGADIYLSVTCESGEGSDHNEMSHVEGVTISKEVQCGVPVITGTRIPVSTILSYLAHGYSEQQLLEDFPRLKPIDIRRALEFAVELLDKPIQ